MVLVYENKESIESKETDDSTHVIGISQEIQEQSWFHEMWHHLGMERDQNPLVYG